MEVDDYAMREIVEEDLPQLLAWRNSPEIHSKMLTDHIITWEEHLAWFKKIKKHRPVVNFAFTYKGKLAGYTGCSQYDEKNKMCDTGDYLGPDLDLPVDAGIYLGEMLSKYIFCELGIKKIVTNVFVDNVRILKLNLLAGGKIIGKHLVMKSGVEKEVATIETSCSDWMSANNPR